MSASNNFETNAIRTQTARSDQREHSVPIYATSSFVFEDAEQARALFANEVEGNIYTRFSNPNNDEFIEKVALTEDQIDLIAKKIGIELEMIFRKLFRESGLLK